MITVEYKCLEYIGVNFRLLCIFENADKEKLMENEGGIHLNPSIPKFHDYIYLNYTSSMILPNYLPSGLFHLYKCHFMISQIRFDMPEWSLIPGSSFGLYSLVPSLLCLPFKCLVYFTSFAFPLASPSVHSLVYFSILLPDLIFMSLVLTAIQSHHFPVDKAAVALYVLSNAACTIPTHKP